jgi:FK506-binding nuclear protein
MTACSRFEEIIDEKPEGNKTLKRDSETMAAGEKIPAAENKRQKLEGGKAVTVGTETKADGEDKKDKKKKKKKDKKGKDEKEDTEIDKAQPEKSSDKKDTSAAQGAVREIAGGIKIKDFKPGTGPQAKKGNTVSMRYIGKLENGKVFDKNTKGKPVGLVPNS